MPFFQTSSFLNKAAKVASATELKPVDLANTGKNYHGLLSYAKNGNFMSWHLFFESLKLFLITYLRKGFFVYRIGTTIYNVGAVVLNIYHGAATKGFLLVDLLLVLSPF